MVSINVLINVDQHVGLASGEPVTAVLDFCDICDVDIVIEALGVSNSGEKNKINI